MPDRFDLISEKVDTKRPFIGKRKHIDQGTAQGEFTRFRHEIDFPEAVAEEHFADSGVRKGLPFPQRQQRIPDLLGTQDLFIDRFGVCDQHHRGKQLLVEQLRGDLITSITSDGRAAFPTGQRRQSRRTLQQRSILFILGFLGRSRKKEQVFLEQEIVEVGRQVIGFFLGTCNHNVKRTCRGALHRMGYIDSLGGEYHRI